MLRRGGWVSLVINLTRHHVTVLTVPGQAVRTLLIRLLRPPFASSFTYLRCMEAESMLIAVVARVEADSVMVVARLVVVVKAMAVVDSAVEGLEMVVTDLAVVAVVARVEAGSVRVEASSAVRVTALG